jgi:hypothetical protein
MPHKLKGTLNEEARILVFKAADFSLEYSEVFPAGDWEIDALDDTSRIVVAVTGYGEGLGFGDVAPRFYDDLGTLLAIDDAGDILAIDIYGNGLIV